MDRVSIADPRNSAMQFCHYSSYLTMLIHHKGYFMHKQQTETETNTNLSSTKQNVARSSI